jgi:hypothetical protein
MRSLAFLSIPLLLVLACGGSSSSTIVDPPSGDGGADTSSTSSSSGGNGGYTLDNVCDLIAPKICTLRKSCCEKSHGYDEAACLANAKADCAKDVTDTRGGRMTFHPELIDPCLAKFKPILDACFETIDLLFEAAAIADCRIFQGQLDEGARCARDSECKSGPPGAFVDCNDERQVCTYTRFFKEGEACRYGDNAGGFCEKGLYCDAPLGSSVAGTCKKATPVGQSCDTLKLVSTECGLGAYCDRGSGKCAPAKDADAACDTAFECKSLQCESSGSGGRKCLKPDPIVSENECK